MGPRLRLPFAGSPRQDSDLLRAPQFPHLKMGYNILTPLGRWEMTLWNVAGLCRAPGDCHMHFPVNPGGRTPTTFTCPPEK